MTTNRAPRPPSLAWPLPFVLAFAMITGCSSAAHPVGPAAASTTRESVCSRVAAALSDGPDPGADPVGYAEAQIIPLRGIRTTDAALRRAITGLADAYQRFYDSDGHSATSEEAVTVASKKINSFCPGAAS